MRKEKVNVKLINSDSLDKLSEKPNKNKDSNKIELCINYLNEIFDFFKDTNNIYYAKEKGMHILNSIESKQFNTEVTGHIYDKFNIVLSNDRINAILKIISFNCDNLLHNTNTRYAYKDNSLFIDVGDKNNSILKINKDEIVYLNNIDSNVPFFIRGKGFESLPKFNADTASIEALKKYINNVEDKCFIIIISWLLAVMNPEIPCPILIFKGEQGTGKSTLSKILRMLCDPNSVKIATKPANSEDICISAIQKRLVSYDNLSGINNNMADVLCGIVSGTGLTKRQLHTTADEYSISIKRAILLNGINSLTERGDLLDRAIINKLNRIENKKRKTEKEILDEFEKDSGPIFSALLLAIQYGMRNPIKLDSKPRLADFAEWASSCLLYFNVDQKEFLDNLKQNRSLIFESIIECEEFIQVLENILKEKGKIEGSISEIIKLIKEFDKYINHKEIPSLKKFKKYLERYAPTLRHLGIYWKSVRTSEKRNIIFELKNK